MSDSMDYYVELSGPLAEPKQLRIFAGLDELPRLEAARRRYPEPSRYVEGEDAEDEGEPDQARLELRRALSHETTFAVLDQHAFLHLETYLAIHHNGWRPAYFKLCRNPSLEEYTQGFPPNYDASAEYLLRRYPPNYDGASASKPVTYPAPFFVYGHLLDPQKLADVLGIHVSVASELDRAHTFGFELQDCGDYKKAKRATLLTKLEGSLCWINNAAEHAALASYETSEYEIQECKIYIGIAGEDTERVLDGFIFIAKDT